MEKNLRKELFTLFLIITFPIQAWSLFQVFFNFEWVAERTIVWDAFGYAAYALGFAFFESLLFFLIITPFYLLLRKSRDAETVMAVIGTLFLTVAVWEILHRLNMANSNILDITLLQFQDKLGFRYRYVFGIYVLLGGIIAASIGLPPFFIIKSKKYIASVNEFFQRIGWLSYFFLVLDVLGIVIIIIRNTLNIQI